MFEWKPEYSVQIPEIDAQHKRLFALAAELHIAMTQGKGKAVLDQTLGRLVDYTRAHFASEELLMKTHRYPLVDKHKGEHSELTDQVVAFQKRMRSGECALTVEVLEFLTTWLQHHINGSDKKYAAHIRSAA